MSTNNQDGGTATPEQTPGQKALADGRLVIGNKAENGAFEVGKDGKPVVIDGADATLDLTEKPEAGADETLPEGDAAEKTQDGEQEPAGDEDASDTPEDSLGEWKSDDPEVVAKFDGKFLREDGTLNEEAIGTEFWTDYAKLSPEERAKADLRPETRAYLKDTFKVSDGFIDQTRDGLVALQEKTDAAFMEAFGGRDAVTGALDWARSGGYTEEQRARFNDLQAKGGEEFKEAMELLISRHQKASGTGTAPSRDGLPGRKSTPARNATKNAAVAGGGAEGAGLFATKDAYQKAWTEGLQAEKAARRNKQADPEAWRKADAHVQELRKKGRQSAKFWK